MNIKKIISLILVSLVILFIIKYFFANINELRNYEFSLNPYLFLLSIFCLWIWMFINSVIYDRLIKKIDSTTNFKDNLKIWCYSYLGRYVPGKVGIVASRIYWHKKNGLNPQKVAFIFYIESILSIISSLLVFLLSTFIYNYPYLKNYKNISILLIVLILISLHPRILNRLLNLLLRVLKKENKKIEINFNYRFYFSIIFINLIKWFFIGLGVFLIINSLYNISFESYPFIVGSYSLAAVIGYVSLFAPSGIGVIEGILTYSFKFIIPGSLAVIVSILIRVWKTISEISLVLLLFLIFKIKDNFNKKEKLQNNII